MTRDDIIRMAREAGAKEQGADLWGGPGIGAVTTYWLERFAALVAADERESCAQLIEPKNEPSDWTEYAHDRHEAAMIIRARGQEQALAEVARLSKEIGQEL